MRVLSLQVESTEDTVKLKILQAIVSLLTTNQSMHGEALSQACSNLESAHPRINQVFFLCVVIVHLFSATQNNQHSGEEHCLGYSASDGDHALRQSRGGIPTTRYWPSFLLRCTFSLPFHSFFLSADEEVLEAMVKPEVDKGAAGVGSSNQRMPTNLPPAITDAHFLLQVYFIPSIDTPPTSPPHLQPTTITGSVLTNRRGYSDMASSAEDIESVRIRVDRVIAKQSRDTLPQDIRVSASPQGPHLPIGHQDFADEVRSVSFHSAGGANDVGLHSALHTYLGGNHSLPSLLSSPLSSLIYLSIYL